MNLVDTSGWIEYFFAGPNAAFFSDPIEATKELIVPTICLYEVFKKVNAVADEAKALQAVAQMKSSDGSENQVVDEIQKGYFLEGRVLRAAMVRVSRAGSAEPGDGPTREDGQA